MGLMVNLHVGRSDKPPDLSIRPSNLLYEYITRFSAPIVSKTYIDLCENGLPENLSALSNLYDFHIVVQEKCHRRRQSQTTIEICPTSI